MSIFLALITGITTGGLSCLAVQGGLLAGSLAGQIEKDLLNKPAAKRKAGSPASLQLAQPILAFLAAKLLAYTLMGFLLGMLGQVFQLSPLARSVLLVAVGIFMLGSALRMLNVHPIFRYFAFEPPAFIRRKLRRTAAQGGDTLAVPAFLGLMTVLIPCGVTQAMMAVALGTGSPLQGAALMFAFTLGTSPVFFAVTYFATKLGARLEKNFTRFAAVVVLILALVTIDSGLTLAGSPLSVTRWLNRPYSPPAAAAPGPQSGVQPAPAAAQAGNVITINVKNNGYEPGLVHARAGEPVTLRLVTDNVRSCSRAFVIPALNLEKILDATGEVLIEIPAQEKGTRMPFSCSMGMYGGDILFDL